MKLIINLPLGKQLFLPHFYFLELTNDKKLVLCYVIV
jgi:hypothetical protein